MGTSAYNNNNNGFLGGIPFITRNILIINVLVWLACFVFNMKGIDLPDYIGLHYWKSKDFNIVQLVTHVFTHVSFSHLFFNMFALFMFGGLLERVWGPKRYLSYYLVTGIGAGIVQLLVTHLRIVHISSGLSPAEIQQVYSNGLDILHTGRNYIGAMGDLNLLVNTVTIGASGAVFGLLLAFGMLFPNTPLYIIFIPIPIKAKYFVIGYGLVELWQGVYNASGDNVAHFAHLGGMLFGIFMILYWRKKGVGRGTYF